MNRFFTIFFCALAFVNSSFSQSNDTIIINDAESQFSDSIAKINEQNSLFKASRDAYNTALSFLNSKEYQDAVNNFSEAIVADSLFVEAYLGRAKCYEVLNQDLAIADYMFVYALDSSDFSSLYKAALLYKDKDVAKEIYLSILSMNDAEVDAYNQLGIIAFLEENYKESERLFSKSLSIKVNAYTLNDRGSAYRKLNKQELGISDYLAAIALNTDLAFIYNNLASVYKDMGETEKALKYFDLAIEKDNDYVIAYNNKASLLLEAKDYSGAKTLLEEALSINPDYAPAYNNRGVLNHNIKKYNDALTDFDRAISLNSTYAKAYLNRGISKQMLRDVEGACKDWKKAKEFGIVTANKYLTNDCE